MRKLTGADMADIMGTSISGYKIIGARVKHGSYNDSDHYGILLGRSEKGYYVTWQFHLDEDERLNAYWGHYFMERRNAAMRDFNTRDMDWDMELSEDFWDCECEEKYIQSNRVDVCPICGSHREDMPDSRQNEVDEGTHFAGISNAPA